MKKHNISDLIQMQSLPLCAKVQMTVYRVKEWVDAFGEEYEGEISCMDWLQSEAE